ncbi:MAG: RtcB family protein, partial [Planctomycetota bacterium]
WTAAPLGPDVEASLGRLASAGSVAHVSVMPDAHLAHDVCVGTVLATRGRIYPAAVGGDIGCGMAAIALDGDADILADEAEAARLLSALYDAIPCLKQRRAPPLPAGLANAPLSDAVLERRRSREGRWQLGTLGRGNHFVEFQRDDEQRLWLMVHSGSRSKRVATRPHHLPRAHRDAASALMFLDADGEAGRVYLSDHDWALNYAEGNRARLVERAVGVVFDLFSVSADPAPLLTCHHNHVRREDHFGEPLWVHRKGAICAREGEPGIVPGSMGTASYHTSGRGCALALASSSHGAGRAMSRTAARQRIPLRDLRRQMRGVWYDHRHERRLLDEAPGAYRNVGAVMRAQRELTRVVRRLRPVLVFKGV